MKKIKKVKLAPRKRHVPVSTPATKPASKPAPKPASTRPDLPWTVCVDWQRRTCIEISRDTLVTFVQLESPNGLVVGSMTPILFDHRFKPLHEYSIEKACKIYIEYGKMLGASKGAISILRRLIPISMEEELVMTKKTEGQQTAGKSAPTKKVPTEKRESAAQMFQDLIMKGTFSDDVIFKKVQEKFGLDDKKRGYVTWYRNYLRKQGKKPPEAKGGKK